MPSASKQDKNNVFPNNLIRSICTVSRLRITDKQFHFFILLSHLQYNNFEEQLFYCDKELRLKISRKERSKRRLSLLGSIGRIPELFDKKFEPRTVAFSLF